MSERTKEMRAAGSVLFGLVATLVVSPAAHAQDFVLTVGDSGGYTADAFCVGTDAFINTYHAGVDGTLVGAEASFNNSAWPWPPIPPSGTGGGSGGGAFQGRYLSQGDAIAASVKAYPVAIIQRIGAEGLAPIDRLVRPFVGVGLQRTSDGDTAPAGQEFDLPLFGIRGQTAPLLTLGVAAHLPGRDSRLGLVVEYRRNYWFAGEFEVETDTGEVFTTESETLEWGEFNVGFRLRLGQ